MGLGVRLMCIIFNVNFHEAGAAGGEDSRVGYVLPDFLCSLIKMSLTNSSIHLTFSPDLRTSDRMFLIFTFCFILHSL